ncbi:DEAD/DEAH box helicase [Gramella sp. AN32]|uniref:DNA 3'-5' helicase n=1 Tax=Christiangramia antarctica TaxID=2058158 RepID=A0ABW5X6C6_9FLAO|nr:DEAD/DEAH box helicase [Gramella sp. AN32]MCM4156185.1 hypothetical protein [Gramella sp. AN32]
MLVNVQEKIKGLLINKLNKYSNSKAIISIKGLPFELVKETIGAKFIEEEYIEDRKLNINKLDSKEGKKLILQQMMTSGEKNRFISYEALLYSYRLTKEIGIDDDIIVIDFSIHPYSYSALKEDLPLLEDLSEKGDKIEENLITSLYASVVKIGENKYVQFRDQEILNDATVDYAFHIDYWSYKELPAISNSDKTGRDLVFNYEARDYVDFIHQLIVNEGNEKQRILVDTSVKANSSAQEQLGKIIDFFGRIGIEPQLLKIKYDLTISARKEIQEKLKEVWGYDGFRSLKVYADPEISNDTIEISQADIIETIVEEYEKAAYGENFDDVFVTAPTGAGKSIMFQLPAIYLGEKFETISIVITPLKSLMVDQVNNLKETGYSKVAYINSDITIIQRDEIYDQIKNSEIDLLYLAPESLLSYDISHFLQGRKLGLYIVDEAHTVTTWGRDFRVDYWYLGAHISKVRKYYRDEDNNPLKFPVVAFTATAPYDGIHDVVFETLSSLKIVSAKQFIGYVRRENIDFNINRVELEGNLQTRKTELSVQRMVQFSKEKKKAIIYCPYTNQVDEVHKAARKKDLPVQKYHGGLTGEDRNISQEQFKNIPEGNMVATKAFGMGVDIPDIDQVYHFAPTGLLTDYVQEVGRAARKAEIQGEALVDYSTRDFQFINVLHGLNRTHNWQLVEVMKRLWRFYDDNKRQNQLISAEDFAYIFNSEDEGRLQNSVKNALMLLEKDLNKKANIPVLIARPKNLFATVYASISNEDLPILRSLIPKNSFKEIHYLQLDQHNRKVVQLKLNKIWEKKFSDKSFGVIKREFFMEELFPEVKLRPKLKIHLVINESSNKVLEELKNNFNTLNIALNNLKGTFFTKNEFVIQLSLLGRDINWSKRVAEFVLPLFSQRSKKGQMSLTQDDVRKYANFLQSRRDKKKNEITYRVIDGAVNHLRSKIRRKVNTAFFSLRTVTRYVDKDGAEKHLYIKIGQLFEIFELGTYEVNGGENPKIFIRINDPFRLRVEAYGFYQNDILQNIRDRHTTGVELMKEFFESDLTSAERWDFIENFFLGRKQ